MNQQKESERLKEIVKEKYSEIAAQDKETNASSCCGATCGCSTIDSAIMADDYSKLSGYVADADLGLGCGLPTEFALIQEGDTVIDLGSGAGNDCFVARSIAGFSGKIIGIDFTEKMIERARLNAEKLGYHNVEFRYGDIENLPVNSDVANVVVSNCVLNLVPDKARAFAETFRVLKAGGHFSVSDIVLQGQLPDNLKEAAEMYAGCISGAIQKEEYLKIVQEAGFTNIRLQKEKKITIPDEILKEYIAERDIHEFNKSENQILSITLYAEKPNPQAVRSKVEKKAEPCCEPGCCGN